MIKTTSYNLNDKPVLEIDQKSQFFGFYDSQNFVTIEYNGIVQQQNISSTLKKKGKDGIKSIKISSQNQAYFLGDKYFTFWIGDAKTLTMEYNHTFTSTAAG